MKRALFFPFVLWLCVATSAHAHEIVQSVSRGSAVVITLSEPDGSPFSYESYEIYREGEEVPYQTGRSDALGRIVFVPDRRGTWRVRGFSEDGHGIDTRIEAGPDDATSGVPDSPGQVSGADRYNKIAIGIFVILLIFLVAMRILRRRGV
jgi:nickel transport protein